MEQPPPPNTEKTLPPSPPSNPVVAVGRKVKSVFTSHQQPSVRIIRQSSPVAESTPLSTTTEGEREDQRTLKQSRSSLFNVSRKSFFGRGEETKGAQVAQDEYDTDTVDLMDVMDPEVSTLATLTNVQNSLFVPSLGKFVNRRPEYRIEESPGEASRIRKLKAALKNIASGDKEEEKRREMGLEGLQGPRYAILPPGEALTGWTMEEKAELNDKVRHMLHSRRSKFKRSLKGFGQYVRRPFGLFITIYATLITLFGAAWVFFLIGWVSLGSKRDYVVNVVDNILVALFAIIGDGLAPFRAVDTYHMIYIAYYHRKTWSKREKLGLPELVDRNDLPDQRLEEVRPQEADVESLVAKKLPSRLARRLAPRLPKSWQERLVGNRRTNDAEYEYTVLTPEQQDKLEFHERKFSKSHTFYKPHETATHFAFPLNFLIAIVLLLDLHSCLQISLGACTWAIPYQTRPFALTTVILCCSICANITGGVLISIGDKRTRKRDVIERLERQELTEEAIEAMQTRWMKEAEERGEMDPAVRKQYKERNEEQENEEIKRSWKAVPLLPKTLLGKGEDRRQEALPREARRSSADLAEREASGDKKSKSRSALTLPAVKEDAAQSSRTQAPAPVVTRGQKPPEEGIGRKIVRLARRADLDRS